MEFTPVYDNTGMVVKGLGQVNPVPAIPYCLTPTSAFELASILGAAVDFAPPFGVWPAGTVGVQDTPNAYHQSGMVPWLTVSGVHVNAGLMASYWLHYPAAQAQSLCLADIEARKTDTTA